MSYRTPEEVLDFAAPTLRAAAPDARAAAPGAPSRRLSRAWRWSSPDEAPAALAAATARELAAVAPGRVAVIAPSTLVDAVVAALRAAGLDPSDPRDAESRGLASDLVVLGAEATQRSGVRRGRRASSPRPSPARLARRAPTTARGLRTLYVAMTRPTRRLAVVSGEPLPSTIAALEALA